VFFFAVLLWLYVGASFSSFAPALPGLLPACMVTAVCIQYQHRHELWLQGSGPLWLRLSVHLMLLVGFLACWHDSVVVLRRFCLLNHGETDSMVRVLFAVCLGLALLLADAVALGIISRQRKLGRLRPWSLFRLRYSLQSLVLAVLGIGAYASVVFLLGREGLLLPIWDLSPPETMEIMETR
jgi:hypothetical protein